MPSPSPHPTAKATTPTTSHIQTQPQIHTYHCICSTLLLATPYRLDSLPRRAAPSLDKAIILPLPALTSTYTNASTSRTEPELEPGIENPTATSKPKPSTISPSKPASGNGQQQSTAEQATEDEEDEEEEEREDVGMGRRPEEESRNDNEDNKNDDDNNLSPLPSLPSPYLRPSRRPLAIRRADGFEIRRVWRCGRCGIGVGYEVLDSEGPGGLEKEKDKGMRVLYLLEEGLVETGEMMVMDGIGGGGGGEGVG